MESRGTYRPETSQSFADASASTGGSSRANEKRPVLETGFPDRHGFQFSPWADSYRFCIDYFVGRGQYSEESIYLALLLNIRLPFQKAKTPEEYYIATEPVNRLQDPPRPGTSSEIPIGTFSPWVTLVPYVRRLIITGSGIPANYSLWFGPSWREGLTPIIKNERRNLYLAIRDSSWLRVKEAYDIQPDEHVPYIDPHFPEPHEFAPLDSFYMRWMSLRGVVAGARTRRTNNGTESSDQSYRGGDGRGRPDPTYVKEEKRSNLSPAVKEEPHNYTSSFDNEKADRRPSSPRSDSRSEPSNPLNKSSTESTPSPRQKLKRSFDSAEEYDNEARYGTTGHGPGKRHKREARGQKSRSEAETEESRASSGDNRTRKWVESGIGSSSVSTGGLRTETASIADNASGNGDEKPAPIEEGEPHAPSKLSAKARGKMPAIGDDPTETTSDDDGAAGPSSKNVRMTQQPQAVGLEAEETQLSETRST